VDLGNRGSILRRLVLKNANPTFQRYLDGVGRLVSDNRSIQGGGNGPPLPGLGAGAGGNNFPIVIPPVLSPQFYYASYGFYIAKVIEDGNWSGFVPTNENVYTLSGSNQYNARSGEENNYLYCGKGEAVEVYDEKYNYTFLIEKIVPSLLQGIQTGKRQGDWMIDSIVFIPYQDGSSYSLIQFNSSSIPKITNLADISDPSSPTITLEATRNTMGEEFRNKYPLLFNMNLDGSFNNKYKFRIVEGSAGGSQVAYNLWRDEYRGGELEVTFRIFT
jgi:hypothetical protein